MKTYIDLSHVIGDGIITYKGLPAPIICDFLSREASKINYEAGTSFQIGRIDMVANTGTYIDCPFHRYADGKDLAQVLLDRFVDLPAVKVTVPYTTRLEVGIDSFKGVSLKGKAVIIATGWSAHWMTDLYYQDHSYVSEEAAEYLVAEGALLVGIDSHNIDDTRSKARRVHSILLKQEVLIVEHLCNLDMIDATDFLFTAAPPKIQGMSTFPVRAYATIENVS